MIRGKGKDAKPEPKQMDGGGLPIPTDVEERTKRSVAYADTLRPKQQECWEFFRGNHYAFVSHENRLQHLPTATSIRSGGKPPHKVRHTSNILVDLVRKEVGNATSRVPSYEIIPATNDQKAVNGAKMAERVASYGYDKWGILEVTEDAVTSAIVADEGFARAYWDPTVGPVVGTDEDGTELHEGEVSVCAYTSEEVSWEPGVKFEDSRYWIISKAMPVDQVMDQPGYIGGVLSPDAKASRSNKSPEHTKLVMVREYLERPCPKYENGRRIQMANGKQIRKEEGYPLIGVDGKPVDEPPLVKIGVISDPDHDRDQGLVRHSIDAIRTFNDCNNRILEWKNLAMLPQAVTTPGNLKTPLNDVPGAVFIANRPELVNWRTPGQIPPQLFQVKTDAEQFVRNLFSFSEIPSGVESAQGIQTVIERDNTSRAMFIRNLAKFHSRLMRMCLMLVARHYTEPRLIEVRGDFGWESIKDFQGADMHSQVMVQVSPASIEPRTKAAMEARINAWADKGWISPQAAMAAISDGTASALIDTYEKDISRAHRIVQRAFEDPGSLLNQPRGPEDMPAWMPRPFDNVPVHKAIFEDAMKTEKYETAPPETQEVLHLYYEGLKELERQEQQKQIEQQNQMASSLGMKNAAAPQVKEIPDQPSPEGGNQPPPEPA